MVITLEFLANNKVVTKEPATLEGVKVEGQSSSFMTWTHTLHSSPSLLELALVMMSNTATIEEKMTEMEQKITLLTSLLEDRDLQIVTLMNKLEVQGYGESSQGPKLLFSFIPSKEDVKSNEEKETKDSSRLEQSTSIGSLFVQQLQDMIINTVRAQYGGACTSSLMYSKPYTKRIDNMRMPNGYQPPKFHQFDGKGSPKQHVVHFVETCENAGT